MAVAIQQYWNSHWLLCISLAQMKKVSSHPLKEVLPHLALIIPTELKDMAIIALVYVVRKFIYLHICMKCLPVALTNYYFPYSHIHPGTIIRTDQGSIYNMISTVPSVPSHGTVNCSVEFVESTTRVHTKY